MPRPNPRQPVNIIDGKVSPIDIFRIVHDQEISYAFNIIGWGMASDVNIKADQLRWLGANALFNFCSHKHHGMFLKNVI